MIIHTIARRGAGGSHVSLIIATLCLSTRPVSGQRDGAMPHGGMHGLGLSMGGQGFGYAEFTALGGQSPEEAVRGLTAPSERQKTAQAETAEAESARQGQRQARPRRLSCQKDKQSHSQAAV